MTSSRAETLEPPRGGTPPPDFVQLEGGQRLFLGPLAHEIAERHFAEFPDERERYGDAGFEWCVHDAQYLLWWAVLDSRGTLLREQVSWLARVLVAREYPVERLSRTLELAADVAAERRDAAGDELAATLRAGAKALRT